MIKAGQVYKNFLGEEFIIDRVDQDGVTYTFKSVHDLNYNTGGTSFTCSPDQFENNISHGYMSLSGSEVIVKKDAACNHEWIVLGIFTGKECCKHCGIDK